MIKVRCKGQHDTGCLVKVSLNDKGKDARVNMILAVL